MEKEINKQDQLIQECSPGQQGSETVHVIPVPEYLSELTVIHYNGSKYLGIIKDEKGIVKINYCMEIEKLDGNSLKEWILLSNTNELKDMVIRNYQNLSTVELSEDEKRLYELYSDTMKLSKQTAIRHIENTIFIKLLEKVK